jgi:malonate decarboxylase epsilon subunit
MSVAMLFPGQGAQQPGMLARVPDTPTAQAALNEALQICDELHGGGNLDDPGRDTVATQLSLLAVGVACARAVLDDEALPVTFVAGHSVGAFAAAVTAGVLSLRDALATVHLRADSMRAACSGRAWGMAAITGATTSAVRELVADVSTADQPLWVANVNSATQTVVGGTAAALDAAERRARLLGARGFERLDVEIASHGAVQAPTEHALRAHLARLTTRAPALTYVTNSGGRAVRSAEAVVEDLAQSVTRTVRWYDGVRLLGELGVSCALEASPGHTLSRLMTSAVPAMTAIALDDDGLPAAVRQARRS